MENFIFLAFLQNRTSRKSVFIEQNFKKKPFYRTELQKTRIYRSELQKNAILQIRNSLMFHFSPFFKSNYFLIQISDFNFESCTRIGIARSVDFRRVPANGYMSVTGYSDMPSYNVYLIIFIKINILQYNNMIYLPTMKFAYFQFTTLLLLIV